MRGVVDPQYEGQVQPAFDVVQDVVHARCHAEQVDPEEQAQADQHHLREVEILLVAVADVHDDGRMEGREEHDGIGHRVGHGGSREALAQGLPHGSDERDEEEQTPPVLPVHHALQLALRDEVEGVDEDDAEETGHGHHGTLGDARLVAYVHADPVDRERQQE